MTTIPALTSVKELGIKDVIATSWSDDGCEAPVYHYLFGAVLFAELDYQIEFDMEIFKEKLAFISELSYEEQMWMDRIDLPNVKSANPITNVSKYVLYQDPMSGIFDYHLKDVDLTEHFNEVRQIYKKLKLIIKRLDYSLILSVFRQGVSFKMEFRIRDTKSVSAMKYIQD